MSNPGPPSAGAGPAGGTYGGPAAHTAPTGGGGSGPGGAGGPSTTAAPASTQNLNQIVSCFSNSFNNLRHRRRINFFRLRLFSFLLSLRKQLSSLRESHRIPKPRHYTFTTFTFISPRWHHRHRLEVCPDVMIHHLVDPPKDSNPEPRDINALPCGIGPRSTRISCPAMWREFAQQPRRSRRPC